MYYGPETLYLSNTLVADSDYQCRVFAVNCQGTLRPSLDPPLTLDPSHS